MSVWTCAECTARYAIGLEQCPQCGSNKHSDKDPDDLANEQATKGRSKTTSKDS